MSLAVFALCVIVVASSGAIFKPDDWYRRLAKPKWNPPDWAFGAGWTIFYTLIAVAGWRVWEGAEGGTLLLPMAVYGVQLFLNALWSAVFFGLKRPDLAFAELACLWLAIVVNIVVFHPIDAVAAWLLVPYLGWVTFAGALNFTVWRLNRSNA